MLVTKGGILAWLGRFREAVRFCDEGLSLAHNDRDTALQAYALTLLANAYAGLGVLDRAKECDTESVALYQTSGDLAGLARSHVNLASSCFPPRRPGRTRARGDRASSLLPDRQHQGGGESSTTTSPGLCFRWARWTWLSSTWRRALRLRSHQGVDPQVAGFALVLLCKAHIWAGDLDVAERELDESVGILKRGDVGDLLDAGVIEAELRLAQGDLERAESACRAVLEQARSMEAELNVAQALCMLGRIQLARGDPEAAVSGLKASLALAQRIGAAYEHAQALAALAEAQAACAEADPACGDLLGEAIARFKNMGARYDLAQAEALRTRLRLAQEREV